MTEPVSYINYHTDYDTVSKSLFLERKLGLVENLRNEFPQIWELYKQLKSLDWDENEIDITSCRAEFLSLPEEITQLMISTLAWQFEADSSAAHIAPLMLPFVSCTEMAVYLTQLSGNECLTPDHEVLTPTGWKAIDQITTEDKVAQWEYDSRDITFVHPQRVISKNHTGTMYHFFDISGSVDQVVTPNHRMPMIAPYCSGIKNIEVLAKDANYHRGVALPTSGVTITTGRGMTVQERLYVAVQADGSLCSDAGADFGSGRQCYKFGFSEQRKIDRLHQLCEQAGWGIKEIEKTHDNGARHFYVYVPNEEFRRDVKDFDWIDLEKMSSKWALDFLNELQYWDGSVTEGGRTRYLSSNKKTIDVVIAVAHLAGHRAHVTDIPARQEVSASGEIVSGTRNAYQIHLTPRDYVVGSAIEKQEIEYEGTVHCLTVPSGFFLVKRNHAVGVTGNCLHSLAYKVIVESSFDNPNEFLDELLSIKESFQRLDVVKSVFDETHLVAHRYALGLEKDELLVRKTIFKFWVTALALERIQFMSSFAITFGLAENGFFVPIAKLVQKICTDEFQVHVEADKAILRNEMALESNFPAYLEALDDIAAIVKEITESELTWLDYLFGDKEEIAGNRKDKVREFVLYSATEVYSFLNIESPFPAVKENPLPYMNKWIVIDSNQSSPQEESVANYLLGGFVDDSKDVQVDAYGLKFTA